MLKPQQMATVTLVAVVISAFILVLPLLGVALPTRVGAVPVWSKTEGCQMNVGTLYKEDYTEGKKRIPHSKDVCDIMEANTATQAGGGPGICYPIKAPEDYEGFIFKVPAADIGQLAGGYPNLIYPSKSCRKTINSPEWVFSYNGQVGDYACASDDPTLPGPIPSQVVEQRFCDLLESWMLKQNPNHVNWLCEPSIAPVGLYRVGDNHQGWFSYTWDTNDAATVYCAAHDPTTGEVTATFVKGLIVGKDGTDPDA